MIKREKYIASIREFYNSDLIKIITGIRRCGKSVILGQIKDEIEQSGAKCVYLNLEDRYENNFSSANELVEFVLKAKGAKYVFLDEIQNIPNWQEACKTLRLKGLSLFITGSNSKLLSSEFAKELSGRFVSFNIRPFVYKELKEYANELGKDFSLGEYLSLGGFAKILEFQSNESIKAYLKDLDSTVIINDLIARYNIKKTELFKKIVDFVMLSNARVLSANSILNYIKSQKITCSINTVIKYLSHLEEAYAIRKLPKYSLKAKRKLEFFEKVYNEDIAFSVIRGGDKDITHNLENIIYNELIFMGYELFLYDNNGKEIDFLAIKGGKEYLIQVAYSVAENKAYEREIGAFSSLDNSRAKVLITNDEIDFSTSTVKHIKLKDFLLMDEL